jgi:uncharacterized protein
MIDELRRVLDKDPRIAFALLFGSRAQDVAHAQSDVDIAVGLAPGSHLDALSLGSLVSKLETAAGRPVDVVLLDEAPPGLAYRVFRDGQPIIVRDREAFRKRLARAILDYLDFQPIEDVFTQGVLRARHGR